MSAVPLPASSFTSRPTAFRPGLRLDRDAYLALLQTAQTTGLHAFTAQAARHWLDAYPGDLWVSYLYAQALANSAPAGQPVARETGASALALLDRLCIQDPEFTEAARARAWLYVRLAGEPHLEYNAHLYALEGQWRWGGTPPFWAQALWEARQRLLHGDPEGAENAIIPALWGNDITPLVGVTHLSILRAHSQPHPAARHSLAACVQETWPTCIPVWLHLAEAYHADCATGCEAPHTVSPAAQELLRQAAAADVAGQVARRIWPQGVPAGIRHLWPAECERSVDFIVPPQLAAALGWTRLPAPPPIPTPHLLPARAAGQGRPVSHAIDGGAQHESGDVTTATYVILSLHGPLQSMYGPDGAAQVENTMQRLASAISAIPGWRACRLLADQPGDALALNLKPVRAGDAWALKHSLSRLQNLLQGQGSRIGALLIVGGHEIVPFHTLPNPVNDQDAHILSDNPYATADENYFLPQWVAARVPHSSEPSPAYLVKRLEEMIAARQPAQSAPPIPPAGVPGMQPPQAKGFQRSSRLAWLEGWLQSARTLLQRLWQSLRERPALAHSMAKAMRLQPASDLAGAAPAQKDRAGLLATGCTAEIWKAAAQTVLQPLAQASGQPAPQLLVSPPLGSAPGFTGEFHPSQAAYFNLHGLVDAAEWYGHRDPLTPVEGDPPDYPVALHPQSLAYCLGRGGASPIIFSEACYGAHVNGKTPAGSLALRFLECGCRAFAGATVVSYGSLGGPLTAADLLGRLFWTAVSAGLPAGVALNQARHQLASQMLSRQGYLDAEDQKTLISFVLYGDPLATLPLPGRQAKHSTGASASTPTPTTLITVCDPASTWQEASPPEAVLRGVKQVVAQYLPGMQGARLEYSSSSGAAGEAGCSNCRAAGRLACKNRPASSASQQRVILSKQVAQRGRLHTEYARLTLDDKGDLIKLVISR